MENPDARRERLQPQLEKAVGAGELSMSEYERLMKLLWSETDSEEETHGNIDRVAGRVDRLQVPAKRQAPLVPRQDQVALPTQDGKASIMSTVKRTGSWAPKHITTWWAVMGETVLDLREAQWPDQTITLNLQGFFSEYKIIVPPGTRVLDSGTNVASDFTEKNRTGSGKKKRKFFSEDNPYAPGNSEVARSGEGLTVIVEGFNLFSEIKIEYR